MGRRLILDTAVLIALERGAIAADQLIDDDLAIAALTVAEYQVGIEMADNERRASHRRDALAAIMSTVPVLDYTATTAELHGLLLAHVRRVGVPRGAHDLIIAAHAVETRRTVFTTDHRARFANLPGVDVQHPSQD